jgi:hypothetical protein
MKQIEEMTHSNRRRSRREAYRTLEYDERLKEQRHQRVIGPTLDQMILQIPTFDGNPRKLTAFCSNIRKILSIFREECETYLFLCICKTKLLGERRTAITSSYRNIMQ